MSASAPQRDRARIASVRTSLGVSKIGHAPPSICSMSSAVLATPPNGKKWRTSSSGVRCSRSANSAMARTASSGHVLAVLSPSPDDAASPSAVDAAASAVPPASTAVLMASEDSSLVVPMAAALGLS